MKTILIVLAGCAALGLGTAALVVYAGLYDIGATRQHTQLVYSLLETTMHQSVQRRARDIVVPPLQAPEQLARGAACYREHCVVCHGAPGVAPGAIGKSMQPLPGPLVDAARRWRPEELYWITRHGIKMSGMPAWAFRLGDADLWSVVAFLERLPELSPAAYSLAIDGVAGQACPVDSGDVAAVPIGGGDAAASARIALQQYGCTACHAIPGLTGSDPQVGPPLAGIAQRRLLAGRLANTPDNLVRWIRTPRSIDPNTAMPDLGVTEAHARSMASYLATLR